MWWRFDIHISWWELIKRTARETIDDGCLDLAAQLAYYFVLALFPTLIFLVALASFFPVAEVTDDVVRGMSGFTPPDVIQVITDQMRRLSQAGNGGLLTLGVFGALWSSSAAVAGLITALNQAYDVPEGRAWWKVRIIAILLTIALAFFLLISSTLIIAGPAIAERLASTFGIASVVVWTWQILQWPVALIFVMTGVSLVYYFGPDVEQEWVWITPGALLATLLWLGVSFGFRVYVNSFGNYNETYGALGAMIVLLLWLYLSGFAILVGAELNAEIEHSSPHGKAPGEKYPGQRPHGEATR